jgi:battenin
MPLIIPLTYFFLLPRPSAFLSLPLSSGYDDEDTSAPSTTSYVPIPTQEEEDTQEDIIPDSPSKAYRIELSLKDKWHLVRPLVGKYMLPLCKLLNDPVQIK